MKPNNSDSQAHFRKVENLLLVENLGELAKFLGLPLERVSEPAQAWHRIKTDYFECVRAGYCGISWDDVCRFRRMIITRLIDQRVPQWKREPVKST
jgi:hypothetical protein